MRELASSLMALWFDFVSILFAVNPVIVLLIFLPLTIGLSKAEKRRFVHKSMFAALMIAMCVMFIVWKMVATAHIFINIFRSGGGLVLCYMTVRFILKGPKRNQYRGSSNIFPFASPIIAGPATFATSSNSVIENGVFQTLTLLMVVMAIVWITLLIVTIFTSYRRKGWTDKPWANVCSRAIYIPLALLSIKMICKGVYGLLA